MCVTRKCHTFGSGCRCCVHAAVMSRNSVFSFCASSCGALLPFGHHHEVFQQPNSLICVCMCVCMCVCVCVWCSGIDEVHKYAGRQFVYTSASEQCNAMAVTYKRAFHHTMSLHSVSGTPIPGSKHDAEIVPMHFDTHRGCQYKRAQKMNQFLGLEPVFIF